MVVTNLQYVKVAKLTGIAPTNPLYNEIHWEANDESGHKETGGPVLEKGPDVIVQSRLHLSPGGPREGEHVVRGLWGRVAQPEIFNKLEYN